MTLLAATEALDYLLRQRETAWRHQTAVTIFRSRYAWFDGPSFGSLIICSLTSSEN